MSNDISSDQIEIIQEFIQESHDMIDQLEPTIIELGQSYQGGRPDSETMNAIFRLFHSMKGSAGFLELDQISHVAHAAENLLDLIRSDKIHMIPEHIDLLCQSCDFANEALDYVESHFDDQGVADQAAKITALLEEAIVRAQAAEEGAAESPEAEPAPEDGPAEMPELTMDITREMVEGFVVEADELLHHAEQGLVQWAGTLDDQDIIADLFRDLHSFKGNCGFFNYGDLERLSHQIETVMDSAKSGADFSGVNPAEKILPLLDLLKEGVADISQGGQGRIESLEENIKMLRDVLAEAGVPLDDHLDTMRLGELLVEKGVVESEAVAQALEVQKKPVGEILVEMGKVTPEQIDTTLQEQEKVKVRKAVAQAKAKPVIKRQENIRVDLDKLDSLINLIGELVISENMLIHNPDLDGLDLENFNKAAQQMGKIIRDLQEMAMIIRMIPVSGLFRRMIRLVHDLSLKSGKKVDLQLTGEETEIDKTVIEIISDPLVHLLRNSLDHGLEPPDERGAAGKSEKGVLKLSARHEEGEVWIGVEDDGRGLNREKLLAKAIEKGLVEGDGSEMSDAEVYNLIFTPGFSTAEKVTDISGRGVGMDVVKQNLEKIKGKIDVSSKLGMGTRVTLRIPLTLAIIEGMLVGIDRTKCILPLLAIRDIFRPAADAITITPDGKELVKVRGNFYPIIRLHHVLNNDLEARDLDSGVLILVEHQGTGVCLFADEILGQQQTVIKGLSSYFGNAQYVSGCTILGDGEVCLILDVGGLPYMDETN